MTGRVPGGRSWPEGCRGQSSIDFVLGMAVFFLTLTFVVALLPELMSPFEDPAGAVVADRALGTLSGGLLASETPGTLAEPCAADFFGGAGTDCAFDANTPTPELLGVSDDYRVNVTLQRRAGPNATLAVACYDGSDVLDCTGGGDRLARGPPTPDGSRTVRSARRVVRMDDQPLLLTVRVWER